MRRSSKSCSEVRQDMLAILMTMMRTICSTPFSRMERRNPIAPGSNCGAKGFGAALSSGSVETDADRLCLHGAGASLEQTRFSAARGRARRRLRKLRGNDLSALENIPELSGLAGINAGFESKAGPC